MKRIISGAAVLAGIFWAGLAAAQSFWVQVEANATLNAAEEASRRYAADIQDVAGFRLGASGWYATAVGPFTEEAASARLLELLGTGSIPRDSYITDGAAYSQQFWPVGANALTAPTGEVTPPETLAETVAEDVAEDLAQELPPDTTETAEVAAVEPEVAPEPEPEPEETRQEALRSEGLLDADQRKALQVALQWEGFYNAGIDGAFGPGTRASMAAWQEAKGYEATGVLTTRQRARLQGDYQATLDSLGLASVTDRDAGIEIVMPTAMVSFDRYEAPFAHYTGDEGVRVVLISQSGGQSTLYGLYDILQSLEVVPPTGERNRGSNDFTINGEDRNILSYTYATVVDGAVKGYMLIWPKSGDERLLTMAMDAMKSSFASTGTTVLDDNAGLDEAMQSVDLVSGLEVRRADRAMTGFYVDGTGTVLTSTAAVAGCEQITLDESYPASVVASDEGLGIALVKPEQALAPAASAAFLTTDARLKSDVAVAGYSFGGRLSSATLTFGQLADVKGLEGEDNVYRLDLVSQDGDTGGPILTNGGAVIGMLKAMAGDNRTYPPEVSFAVKAGALTAFLGENGVEPAAQDTSGDMAPHALAVKAADMAVLVSCWE
ncbi:serine protease [Maritimibacter sp. DP1N21-5]|uniref:serine protease n=1 Tax=Maritimibacter sp. DP1N21-5 TaxID=2836867 RepID=UPI001C44B7A5|nr:serine protease [Maritimibacter sp. DP1N21-5]MBV7410773.1 trypsin-like peptidase domain-containing protein [Maritimibacter sp. DP1N21-5]